MKAISIKSLTVCTIFGLFLLSSADAAPKKNSAEQTVQQNTVVSSPVPVVDDTPINPNAKADSTKKATATPKQLPALKKSR